MRFTECRNVLLTLACLGVTTLAGAQMPAAPKPGPDPVIVAIGDGLKGDASAQDQAIAEIRELLRSQPQKAVGQLRGGWQGGGWLKTMMDARRYAEVAEFSQQAIIGSASDVPAVEQLLSSRIQALLAANKSAEALAVAKQLFNFSSMKGTSSAILVVSQCLNAAHPDDREVLKRFRQEQIRGAQPPATTQPGENQETAQTVLTQIALDSKPYDEAIRVLTAEDYRTLVTRGNLLLLAGRNTEAWETFERAYSLAGDKDLAPASENLARCMKAQDGAIGRANAWIASIRPKPQVSSLQDVDPNALPAKRN